MSFVVAAALGVGLLIAVPIAAHLLRRGRAREQTFPPAKLVPALRPVARQRSRLEDRLLLATRALLIATLAVLGATPLVRCSRLSLDRESGASLAIALVIDDSLSMRALVRGRETRHQLALEGARELLASARAGDAVAIVLAGRPSRLLLAATTDLASARRALGDVTPSDRATDLDGAVQLARSALKQLPHVDKRVALFSDLAGAEIPSGEPPTWAPLAVLAEPAQDCGVTRAERSTRRVTVHVACNSAAAAGGRSIEVVPSSDRAASTPDAGAAASPGARAPIAAQAGEQTLSVEIDPKLGSLDARLIGGRDTLEADDSAPVAPEAGSLTIAVVSDPATASVLTGGSTVLEQALRALDSDLTIKPLPVVPDDSVQLATHAALLIDDPAGLTPEARAALGAWLERGGVAIAFLGPRATSAQLGSTLEPFAQGIVRWEATQATGLEPASAAWLGGEAPSLRQLSARGRARLDGSEPPGSQVIARWNDGLPFLLERARGRGVALTASLPTSVQVSDFALRAGFLALLAHVTEQGRRRKGPLSSVVGTSWIFPASSSVEATGPGGRVETRERGAESGGEKAVVPTLHGRWQLRIDGDLEERIAVIPPEEITESPRAASVAAAAAGAPRTRSNVDASPELALLLIGIVGLELAIRMVLRSRRRGATGPDRRRISAGDPAGAA